MHSNNNNSSNNNNNTKNIHHSANEFFSLFVGDLPQDCNDDKLQRLFQAKFKSVKRVQVIKNEDGSSKCFGFIRFEDRADFQAALSQEMKIGNNTLRLDMAHRGGKSYRNRFNSFNSTGSNNSSHHNHHHHFNNNNNLHHPHHHQHHHHNQPHHHTHHQHQHGSQQSHQPNQSQNSNNNNINKNNKALVTDSASTGSGQLNQASANNQNPSANTRNSISQQSNLSGSSSEVHLPMHHHQQHQNTHHNTQPSSYNSAQKKNSSHQHQATPDTKNAKQPNLSLGGDDISSPKNQMPPSQQIHTQHQVLPQPQHNLPQTGSGNIGVALQDTSISTTTSAPTNLSNSSQNRNTNAVINNHHNLSANQQAIGPDLRGYMQTAMMDTSHLLGGEASLMPQTNLYGHVYPYGPPPPFGYMHPPPQPNPVIPISAVPPAPSNQASPSSGLSQQHTLTASSASRYSDAQHPHQPQQAHATGADGNTMPGTLAGGVQAPHQGPPFYYYYPSPLYFDQAGAAAPPNLYHPQSFHPQFFAVPNPAYMPNAHTYNQQQTQPQPASQSDATVINPQQPQHQPQVNLRTRDIDTTIE